VGGNDVTTASRGVSGSPSPRGHFTENLRFRMKSAYTFKLRTVCALITRREQRSAIDVPLLPFACSNSHSHSHFWDAFTCIIKICYLFKQILFTLLQRYDENHCVYLGRTRRHNEKKPAETRRRMRGMESVIFCIIYAFSYVLQ